MNRTTEVLSAHGVCGVLGRDWTRTVSADLRNPGTSADPRNASEAAFQESVSDFARLNGWFVWSTRRSDLGRSDPGWPDLALARDGEFLLAELKTEAGRESEVQRASLALLGLAVEVHVWRPSDWDDIERRLRREKGAKYPLSSRVHDVVAQQTAKTRTRKGRR